MNVYERYLPANKTVQDMTIPDKSNSTREAKQLDTVDIDIDFPPLTKPSSAPYPVTEPTKPLLDSDSGIQSPTFKLDLDAAIQLASSSSAISEQLDLSNSNLPEDPSSFIPTNLNDIFGAFPNLMTNVVPKNGTSQPLFQGGGPVPNGNSLGLNAVIPLSSSKAVPLSDTFDFFPALLEDLGNDNDFNVFMNSSSISELQLGQHGEIGNKNNVPNLTSPVSSTSQSTAQHQKGDVTIPAEKKSKSAPSSHRLINRGSPVSPSKVPNNLSNQSKKSPSHVGQSKFADGVEIGMGIHQDTSDKTNGEIAFAQVSSSKLNAEDEFIEVKSKRRQRELVSSPPKSVYPSSPSTVTRVFRRKEHQSSRFAGLDNSDEDEEVTEYNDSDEWSSSDYKFGHGHHSVKPDHQSATHPSNLMRNMVMSYESENSANGRKPNSSKTKEAHGPDSGLSDSNRLDPTVSPSQQRAKADASRVGGNATSHLQLAPVIGFPSNGHSNDLLSKSAPSATDADRCCLICYMEFSTSNDFLRHCESASHCGAVVIATGGDKLPKFPPPHFSEGNIKLCNG